MSFRRLLRVVLSLAIIAILWFRAARDWHTLSALWLAGSLTLSVLLLLIVLLEVTGARRRQHRERDQVPKRPLGLDT